MKLEFRHTWLWAGLTGLAILVGCHKAPKETQLAVSFSQPLDHAQLGPADDADGAMPGIQYTFTAQASDTGGRSIQLASATLTVNGQALNTPAASIQGSLATFLNVTIPEGDSFPVQVDVVESGSGRTAQAVITVSAHLQCDVAFTNPPRSPVVFTQADDTDLTTPGLQYPFSGITHACKGSNATLSKTTVVSQGSSVTTVIGTVVVDPATGNIIFPNSVTSLPDGEHDILTLQVGTDKGFVSQAPTVDVTVHVGIPITISNALIYGQVSLVGPASFKDTPSTLLVPQAPLPAAGGLFLVTSSNVNLYPAPAAGYVVDRGGSPGMATVELDFTVNALPLSTIHVQANGKDLAVVDPSTYSTLPARISLTKLLIPQGTTGTFQILVTDPYGNAGSIQSPILVDVIPPAPSTVVATVTDQRKGQVSLSWTASGDDGTAGAPVGYDIAYGTTSSTFAEYNTTQVGVDSEFTYHDPLHVKQQSSVGPTVLTSSLSGLPWASNYYITARAKDKAGNLAPLVSPPITNNMLNKVVLLPPSGDNSTDFGFNISVGDFNKDGVPDVAVGVSSANKVYVYYGPLSSGSTAPVVQTVVASSLPLGEPSTVFGSDVTSGVVTGPTDAASLFTTDPSWSATGSASIGRAFLYFGNAAAAGSGLQGSVEFRGDIAGSGPSSSAACSSRVGSRLGRGSRIVRDINNDKIDDLLFVAEGDKKVYLFYGRSQAAWLATTMVTGADGVKYIPLSSADRVLGASTEASTNPWAFGLRHGYAAVGDINNDLSSEFVVSSPRTDSNRIYLFSGGAVASAAAGATIDTAQALQTLTQPTTPVDPQACTGPIGLGEDIIGGVNFIAGKASDLLVSYPAASQILIYPDATPSGFGTTPYVIQDTPEDFGYSLATADFNQDGLSDILAGVNSFGTGSAKILFNKGIPGAEFDTVIDQGFNQSRLSSKTTLGISVGVGDFDSNGSLDLLVADQGTAAGGGSLTIYY